ncbi:TetR/AcrR family transcriptional regulator [Pseudonocardia sp. KRD291]|uniref:TetR/AcrR family transcriptional regulator n=1 Tax=Pseudonocardia sp. KRD291 TaxID=2792007 RepID=UPI001C4A61C3|nr:TetR/AcrR family transcriptional regulator [Pseudonocardia sp. KRD291]MBW0101762.1 WHG domain-containing protein [Pseudonocardia sp. KRD291]
MITAEQRRSSTHERFREQVRGDVKGVALSQLAAGGPQSISLNAIAKELGVSGPALYRYYAKRDDLLDDIVIDAYHDLRDAMDQAVVATTDLPDPAERMRELARAYRRWALEHPHRYELLFKPLFPGYDAHGEPIAEASAMLIGPALGLLGDGGTRSRLDARPEDVDHVVRVWSRLHGIVSLEIGGTYAAMDVDADELFATEMESVTARLARPSTVQQGRAVPSGD